MNEPVSLFEVPQRIIQRYIQNFGFLVDSVMKIFNADDVASINQDGDVYGFKKLLILLTEPGKVFALQSFDGTVQWQFYSPQEKVVKVFVEENDGHSEVVLITDSKELRLDVLTGNRISAHPHKIDVNEHSFMQIRCGENQQTIVAVPRGAHMNEQ